MDLQKLLLPWETPEQFPIGFTLGGKVYRGIPKGWQRQTEESGNRTALEAISPEGLQLRLEVCRYGAAVEYRGSFTNRSGQDTPLLEDVRFGGLLPLEQASLYHGNGDTRDEAGYEWWTTPMTQAISIAPWEDGTSCYGAFPYMRLLNDRGGVNIAIGWTGTWVAELAPAEGGVTLWAGQKRCRMVIRPGETIQIPSLTLVAYRGDADAGCNAWRRYYFDHVIPKKDLQPKCCMHLFGAEGKPEFTGATEENQLEALGVYLKRGLKPDIWWIDAGWYPCDFNWIQTGNWRYNPQNFPRGLKPIGDACKQEGMDFLLWFEPERVWHDSPFALEHPHWVLPTGQSNRLVDLGNRECCDYMIELLDRIIKESGVTVYRQDFNVSTKASAGKLWTELEEADRMGTRENLHIQGYYRLWDSLLERNPGLLIDSCAAGGRRNDIETMRRSVPLHYTDVGYGNHPVKLKQHRQMFEWIPYFRAHNHNWCAPDGSYDSTERAQDKFSYYVAMAPALTDILRYDADDALYGLAKEMQAIWRKAAGFMLHTDYYPLTPCRKSAKDFYAAQFHDPASGEGIVHMVNGAAATQTQFTLALKGLAADGQYAFTSAETGPAGKYSGAQLAQGITISMEKKSGDIWFYRQET